MNNYLVQFITERRYMKNVSPKTIEWYENSFKAFEGALESKAAIIARITEIRQRGVSAISVNTYLRCVNAYLRWLHTEHEQELVKIPRLKEDQKVIATLTNEQVKRLLGYKPKGRNQARAHLIACVVLDCGLRISEVLTLTWENVDLDSVCLKVKGKGSKERIVPISAELRKLLFRWQQRHKEPQLFCTRSGTRLTTRNAQRDFKLLFRAMGITGVRCSPHTLRHTFAVGYLRNGGNLFYLSRILGHTTVKTTERYLQNVQIDDLQAVHNRLSVLSLGR